MSSKVVLPNWDEGKKGFRKKEMKKKKRIKERREKIKQCPPERVVSLSIFYED